VVIFSENRPEWIFAFFSIWENSGVALPVDYLSTPKELAYIINDSKPSTIFYSEERKEVIDEALKNVDYTPQLILLDGYESKEIEANLSPLCNASLDDTAVIIYTSGTTGSPKGVMLSFQNLDSNVTAVSKGVRIYDADKRVMILLPLHHIFPLLGSLIAPLYVGGMVGIAPSLASEDIISTLNDNKITLIIGVPRLYAAIRKGIKDKIDKSFVAKTLFALAKTINSQKFSKTIFKTVHKKFGGHLHFLIAGGAALDPAVGQDFKTLGFEVLEGFGMTEAAPMITFTRPGKVVIGSAGQALPGTELAIKDGEIISKGPHIMKGYLNNPEATAEVIKDGWLYTGDLGRIDDNGALYITGRKKEIIVLSSGKNINPVEIEFQLEALMPFAQELAVFEKDDILQLAILPDRVKARELAIENIETEIKTKGIDVYNQSASAYKRILKLHIVHEELPKTRLGKIQRFKLAESIGNENAEKKKDSKFDSEEFQLIKGHIEEDKNIEVFPDDHIEIDLGLDSLDKVSLQVFIENTFGVKINAEKIADHETVKKLSEFVNKMKTKIHIDKINWNDIIKEKVNIKLPKTDITFWFVVKTLKIFFKTYFKFNIKGKENIPQQACIIAPNHQSYLDGMFVAAAISSKTLRNSFFYTKAKHVKSSFLKKFADRNNIIIVDVNQDLKKSIQALAEALKLGKNIVIFPEGTRSETKEMGEFKKTFAILSKELNVPIVPVAISGTHNILPRGSRFPKPFRKVCIEFLKPISPVGHTYFTLAEATKDTIQENLKVM
jgi:long-chain acyl-CoA synthetase